MEPPQQKKRWWNKVHRQRTELSTAASEGDVHRVSSILERTAIDVNFTDPELPPPWKYAPVLPPLLAACRAGHLEMVRVLLKHKDTRVSTVHEREIPLSAAAKHGYTEIMKLLLEHGAGVDYVGEDPDVVVKTALMVAACNGQYEAAVLLLQNGAKVDGIPSPIGKDTPLSLAAGNGHDNLVDLLLVSGANVQGVGGRYTTPPLTAACRGGHIECAMLLVINGANINKPYVKDVLPQVLVTACRAGQLEVVRVLLKHEDIQVNFVHEDETPLSVAAKHGYTEIMKLLLEHGAGVDYVGDDPDDVVMTALMVAAHNGQYGAALLLLQNGAKVDVRFQSQFGLDTPISFAASNDHANLVELLLDNGANVQGGGGRFSTCSPPLAAACRGGHTECVLLLVKKGADISKSIAKCDLSQLLMTACRAGHLEIVRVLLKHKDIRVNFVYEYGTPLSAAARHGHTEIMVLLLEHGAGVDFVGDDPDDVCVWTALMVAAHNGQHKAALLLIQKGAKVEGAVVEPSSSPGKQKPLINYDSVEGSLTNEYVRLEDSAEAILNRGMEDLTEDEKFALPLQEEAIARASKRYSTFMKYSPPSEDTKTEIKFTVRSSLMTDTPLTLAARNGHANLVHLLLDSGASIHGRGGLCSKPLTVACRRGHTECARLLIQRGAPVNEESEDGTPLTCAACNGHTECTKLLLEDGADVNGSDFLYCSPLMLASKNGHVDDVEMLLKHGADVTLSSIYGDTALSLSRKGRHSKIVELLIRRGAKEHSELDSDVSSRKRNVEDGKKESEGGSVEERKKEREDEHTEDSKNITDADAEDLGDASEADHLAAVDRAMKEKGTLDHTLAHGVLVGPARSGKSSLATRLVGEMPNPTLPSTGVAEQAIQVGVKKSYSIALGVLDSVWFKLMYDEEAIRFITLASHNVPFHPQQPAASLTDHSLSPPATSFQSGTESELPTVTLPTPLLHEEPANVALPTSARNVTVSLPAGYVAPMGVFKAALRGKGLEGLRRHLENSWSFYLTDTGGQIEFQDVLPLLVSGPSVFFITFRLDQDLNQRFTIEYHLPDGERSEPYQSTLTVVEAILQTLASIASMGTFMYDGPQVESIPLKSKVLIVGTHKDKLDPATAESDIKKIDQYLQEVVKSTSHYQEDLVEFATMFQMIYTVNNLSEDDSDFKDIRSGVERVVCQPRFKMSFPSHWLIFSLVLRQEMIKESIISFEQCSAIAQDCGISDCAELEHALWFLHTKVGLIRHFPTPGLRDLVIRHPQILFDMVTKLIINTFTFANVSKRISSEFDKKGIFTLEDFKQIKQATIPLLPPEKLLQLLEHLRIVAPFEEKGQKKYFIPCVLAHSEESELQSSLLSSDVPPLLITFECDYCPKGLYGALIQCLLTNDVGSKFKWELMTEQIFRDQVTFDVSPYDTITLKIYPKYLEIIHSCTTSLKRAQKVEDVCNKVRLLVEEGIRKVSSDMKLTSYAKHSLSFYCGHPDCIPKEAHPATKISKDENGSLCNLWCRKSGKTLRSSLPAGYSVWFGLPDRDAEVFRVPSVPQPSQQSSKRPTLSNVFRFLLPLASEWQNIGTLLGVSSGELDTIKADNPGATNNCLRVMLDTWLKCDDPQLTYMVVTCRDS